MIQLSGRLEADALGFVLVFMANLGHAGRLQVTRGPVAGTVDFRDGTVVEVACGAQRGLEALELLLVVPGPFEFSFSAARSSSASLGLDLDAAALAEHLAAFESPGRRIRAALPSLSARLDLVPPPAGREHEEVKLTRLQLALLLMVDGRRTAHEVIGPRALVPALRSLADLVESGLVSAHAPAAPAQLKPSPRFTFQFARVRWPRLSFRLAAWVGVGLFVALSGALQLPDLIRQSRAAFQPGPVVVTELPSARDADGGVSATTSVWSSTASERFWLAADGYHLAPRDAENFVAVSSPVAANSQDVSVTGRFHALRGRQGVSYGFLVRDQNMEERDGVKQNGRFYLFAITGQGRVVVRRRDNDRWIDLISGSQPEAVPIRTESNELNVLAVGRRILFRVNGTEVASIDDKAPTSGGTGFYASGGPAEVVVDGFRLELP